MKFSQLFSGTRIIKQLLDFLQSSKGDAIKERYSDVFEDGVSENELNNMNIVGKDVDVSLTDFLHIKVDTGVAYKAGERIFIDDSTITYNATNPSDTTDDGLGNSVPTPHSTGSFDIPLTSGSINHLYIAYLQTTDESVFTLHKITNAKQFYKRTDGYEIVVNTTGTNPDSSRFLFLGQVDLTDGNQATAPNISISGREFFRTQKGRVGIETSNSSKTDRPTTYNLGNNKFRLDDHIKSVGSGTVSPFNPHGISASDLGLSEDELVRSHRQKEHENGIIAGTPGNPAPTTSALFVERVIVGSGDDFVRVKPLISGEVAIIDGLAFDSTDFPTEVTINFVTGSDSAATYTIFFDSTTATVDKTSSSIVGDNTKMRLATVVWDNAGNLGSPTELRRFGTTNRLQRWFTSSRPPNPFPGQVGFNLDLSQAEYFNGTSWIQY